MLFPARIAARGCARSTTHPVCRKATIIPTTTLRTTAGISTSSTNRALPNDGQLDRKPQDRAKPNYAYGPNRTQREEAGLARRDLSPSSPSRFWPKYEIPTAAKRIECEYAALTGGPVTVGWTNQWLFVQDMRTDDGRRVLKPVTIRDNCECARCRDPDSGQKNFASTEIPADIGIADVRPSEEGLYLTFTKDIERITGEGGGEHETLVPWQSVEVSLKRKRMEDATLPRKRSVQQRTGVVYWDRDILARQVRKIDYEEYMKEDSEAFWDVMIDILRLGIVFLKNVPREEGSVVRIVNRLANIRETFYGRTFDVRAKPNAENVAYTSGYLGLHQDLIYLEPQPMIQVLHYIENSCSGGESLFSDGERVGRLLYPFLSRPKMLPLADHHVPYHYNKRGYSYFSSRHGQYLSPTKDLRPWIEPARIFESLINDQRAIYQRKVEEGECVLFDNQRIMHGRTAFDPNGGGSRWLRGSYIAAEDFLSKAAHIPRLQAEALRGPQRWSPRLAQRELRESEWHQDVLRRVRKIDPDCPSYPQREVVAEGLVKS
ncbi:Dioxygenase str8 [Cladobotryum mycophilum]|uniref:Dioxygenase str8 n=1 Tax=Cladobotryum mycophilum TaxID=491253 RepID=A0ABR0SNT3_9HYPO